MAGWFAQSGAPFAIEAVRRTPSDKKGGHFARRKADGRLVLRETAQTAKEDLDALADLERHRYTSTNNLWIDLRVLRDTLDQRDGVLGLPLIKNTKTLDPGDPSTPEVIQIETAMGAAIEVFEGATLIEVGRDRFVPVKTTNDLLVLRSDVYAIGADFVLDLVAAEVPYVDLDPAHYKLVGEFDKRFPEGAPSMAKASSLTIDGDWTFGHGVEIVGEVALDADTAQRVPAGEVLSGVGWLNPLVSVEAHRRRGSSRSVAPLDPVTVPLADALGLVSAVDVVAPLALPRFDHAAMDGYAVRAADVSARPTGPSCCRWRAWSRPATRPEPTLAPGHGLADHDRRARAVGRRRGGAVRVDRPRRRAGARRPAGRRSAQHIRREGEDVVAGDVAVPSPAPRWRRATSPCSRPSVSLTAR